MKILAQTYPQHFVPTNFCRGVIFLCWLVVSARASAAVTAKDAQGWFASCGYSIS